MNNQDLMYSEVVYLFAHETVPTAGLFNSTEHPSGSKLKVQPLGEQMVFAALAYLKNKEYITLEQRTAKKLFVLNTDKIYLTKTIKRDEGLSGIEKVLLANISKDSDLFHVVINLLDSDEFSPWGAIALYSKNSLVNKGFLTSEAKKGLILTSFKYNYVAGALEEAIKIKQSVRNSIAEFEKQSNTALVKKIISDGIKIREEKSDNSD